MPAQEVRVVNQTSSIVGSFFWIYIVCWILTSCDGPCKDKSAEYCMGVYAKEFRIEFDKGYDETKPKVP